MSTSMSIFRLHAITTTDKDTYNWYASPSLFLHVVGFRRVLEIAAISFVMSVCLSAPLSCSMEQIDINWKAFYEICYVSIFLKSFEKIQVWLKCNKNNVYFTWLYTHVAEFFWEWGKFQTEALEKIKTRVLFTTTSFLKNRAFFE